MKKTLITFLTLALICSPCLGMMVPSSSERSEPDVEVHGGGYAGPRNGFETAGLFVIGVVGGVACVSLGWYILKNASDWSEDEDGWSDEETASDYYEMGFTLILLGIAMPFAVLGYE